MGALIRNWEIGMEVMVQAFNSNTEQRQADFSECRLAWNIQQVPGLQELCGETLT